MLSGGAMASAPSPAVIFGINPEDFVLSLNVPVLVGPQNGDVELSVRRLWQDHHLKAVPPVPRISHVRHSRCQFRHITRREWIVVLDVHLQSVGGELSVMVSPVAGDLQTMKKFGYKLLFKLRKDFKVQVIYCTLFVVETTALPQRNSALVFAVSLTLFFYKLYIL